MAVNSIRMKKFFKFLLILFIIIILIGGAFFAYIYFKPSKHRDPYTLIPQDAVYIIETDNLTKGWEEINSSEVWQKMMKNEYFKDLNKSAQTLDSLIGNSETMNMLFEGRKLMISSHMTSGVDYDFLFVVDLKQASKLSFITDYISNDIVNYFDYTMNRSTYDEQEVFELTGNENGDKIYLSIIDNIFVATFTPTLLEESLKTRKDSVWKTNDYFMKVANEASPRKRFHFYFNYSMLDKYIRCFIKEPGDITASLSKTLKFSAFNFHMKNKRLQFNGVTNINDSVSSYIKALATSKPGKFSAYNILSQNTALYTSMCFENFEALNDAVLKEYQTQDSAEYNDYNKQFTRIENFLKINIKEDFFSWIGNEIAFVKMKPRLGYSNEDNALAVIHTHDISLAKERMGKIMKMVKKRSPLKFESLNYLNYEIHHLKIKGFFKLFFGKLFAQLEGSHFIFLEDYVVFSNSAENLKELLDDYTRGYVLERDEKFMSFKDNFKNKCNAMVFVNMPKLYAHMYYYSNLETKKSLKKNKKLILSFSRIGLQMNADGQMYKTNLISDFDEEAMRNEEVEKFEKATVNISNKKIESLEFREPIDDLKLPADSSGIIKRYYEDSILKFEGSIINGLPEGLWRTYYKSGNIKSAINFKNGSVDGIVIFYYDDEQQSISAKARFRKNKMVGVYREYYRNGVRKLQLEYDDGVADGIIEFYYPNGVLKIQGSYKNGLKHGKWHYYNEDGELFNKIKWKKGEKKD